MNLQKVKNISLEVFALARKSKNQGLLWLWNILNIFLTFAASLYNFKMSQEIKSCYIKLQARVKLKRFIRFCQRQAPIGLQVPENIIVSIIVPVYNKWHLTKACLNSIILTSGNEINYEIILANDCSSDETINAKALYAGLIITKTPVNQGFLRNCNHAAKVARGRYIILLNNDTIVLPGWLQGLCRALDEDQTVAIAGSKILNAKGKIEEAGGVIFRDGSDCHVGRGRSRFAPIYNIKREVDCITGCSIIIRKSFWDSVGGFDERYQNAYFEEYDLMMTARKVGMRVIYQPASEVVHFAHQSYIKEAQIHPLFSLSEQNKQVFLNKWHAILCQDHYLSLPEHLAMSFSERQKTLQKTKYMNILFYSPNPIHPQNHGNRTRMVRLIEHFKLMGHRVHVAILNDVKLKVEDVLETSKSLDVTVDIIPSVNFRVSPLFVPYDGWFEPQIGESVRVLCDKYQIDVVVCSYIYQSKLLEYVPQYIFKIIDTHDKMAERTKMLRANRLPIGQFSCSVTEEAAYLRRADLVIGITNAETEYFKRIALIPKVITISHLEPPNFIFESSLTLNKVKNVAIVASNNKFNLAVVSQCISIIARKLSNNFKLHVIGEVGKDLPKKLVIDKPWLILHGFQADLASIYQKMDIILSPMTCGTGVNIKTVEALAYGMPLLATKVAMRGIESNEPMHQYQDLESLISGLFTLIKEAREIIRLAAISREVYIKFYEQNLDNLAICINAARKHLERQTDKVV